MGLNKKATVSGTLRWWVPFTVGLFHAQHKHTTHSHTSTDMAHSGALYRHARQESGARVSLGVCGVPERDSETAFCQRASLSSLTLNLNASLHSQRGMGAVRVPKGDISSQPPLALLLFLLHQ